MIPTGFLSSLAEGFMPESAQVLRATEIVTGDGTSQSWATVATVAARLSPNGSSANEALSAGQALQASAQWRIALPTGTDVTVRDRIVISGRTFEVSRAAPRSFQAELVVIAVELT